MKLLLQIGATSAIVFFIVFLIGNVLDSFGFNEYLKIIIDISLVLSLFCLAVGFLAIIWTL